MGYLRIRAKAPGSEVSELTEQAIANTISDAPTADARFAAAIAGFGQLLRDDTFLNGWTWKEAEALASAALHRGITAPAAAVDHLFIGEHGFIRRAPVHRRG